MTHTLHRIGEEKDFENDIVVMMMAAKGFNKEGSAGKKKEYLKIAFKYNPVNYGEGVKLYLPDKLNGKDEHYLEYIISNINDDSTPVAVFDNIENVKGLIKELKEKNLGLSVVISTSIKNVNEIMQSPEINQKIFALEQRVLKEGDNVGIYADIYLLPPKDVVKLHSMCGHGMISYSLIERVINDTKLGRIDAKTGAEILSRPCSCGIFNKEKAEKILEKIRIGETDK